MAYLAPRIRALVDWPHSLHLKQHITKIQMIDLNDPSAVCRSLGYFLDFLTMTVPVLSLALIAWRIAR